MKWFVCAKRNPDAREIRLPATNNGHVSDEEAQREVLSMGNHLKRFGWVDIHTEAY